MNSPLYPAQTMLVIATRQIGDLLLVTPLLRSLRVAYPQAVIDVLAFQGKAGMLAGNPDINQVIEIPAHPTWRQHGRLFKRIFRRYDVALATITGDKPLLYAFIAGKQRFACVPPARWQDAWKRWICQRWTLFDDVNTHTVLQNLQLATLLQIKPHFSVIVPQQVNDDAYLAPLLPRQPFVVLHLSPMWIYKRWPQQFWRDLIDYLTQQRLPMVLTGGGDAAELAYIDAVVQQREVVNLAGQLSFSQVARLLTKAQAYVGPDTAVTHLAAACGTLTVALFGPSNPIKWSPWPANYRRNVNPFRAKALQQRVNNVVVLQADLPCVPCHQEGCEQQRNSHSLCMEQLHLKQVIQILQSVC